MPLILFLTFLVVPLVELWAIIQVGAVIGAGWTVALLLVDSVVGAVIVRREGRRAWAAFREALGAGRWPGDEVAQGGLVLVGGALLLTPGFVTDVLGLSFVMPPTRALWSRVVRRRMTVMTIGDVAAGGPGGLGSPASGAGGFGMFMGRRPDIVVEPESDEPADDTATSEGGPRVIDVEVLRVERNPPSTE